MARELSPAEIQIYGRKIAYGETVDFTMESLSDTSNNALAEEIKNQSDLKRIAEEEAAAAAKINDDAPPEDGPILLQGGIAIPEGYEHIGTISAGHEDGSQRIVVDDLEDNTIITSPSMNVSITLNRGSADPTKGYLEGRIIHDGSGAAYIFRRDDWRNDTTLFQVAFTTQGPPK